MTAAPYKTPPLPGMKTAVADADRSSHRLCASWTDAECQFADACLAAWNEAFKSHGTRANRTRHNGFVAVHLLKWINGPDNVASGGVERMTPGDVLVAIAAYAKDPWIRDKCNGRYKSFPDWMKEAPDAVDKQLTRIKKPRGHGAAPGTPAAQAQSKLDIARAWLREAGWESHIAEARNRTTDTGQKASLPESLRIARAIYSRQMEMSAAIPPRFQMLKGVVDDIDERLAAIKAFKEIDPAARKNIFDRAHAATQPIKDERERIAATLALCIEIHRRLGTKAPPPKARPG